MVGRRVADRRSANGAGDRDWRCWGGACAARGLAGAPHALQPLYVRRPDAELERERRIPMSFVIERMRTATDLDAVLEIEQASFNNPTTREWYESELQRPDVCYVYVIRTAGLPGGRILRVLESGGSDSHQQPGDPARLPPTRPGPASARRVLDEATGLGAPARHSKSGDRTTPRAACTSAPGFDWPACGPAITQTRSRMP